MGAFETIMLLVSSAPQIISSIGGVLDTLKSDGKLTAAQVAAIKARASSSDDAWDGLVAELRDKQND